MNLVRRLINWLEKRMLILKLIFVLSVLIFVFFELGRIFRQMSWEKISTDLTQTDPRIIILLLIGGFIAISPMFVYDFVMVSFLPKKFSRKYILKSGLITNTFTNLLGFGGFIGATLRANFYSKGASKTDILGALSKIALFLLSGLSFCCWVILGLMASNVIEGSYSQYLIWIIGGGVYFPLVLLATFFKNHKLLNGLTLKREVTLTLGSILEWLAVSGFFLLIGRSLGVQQHLAEVFMLYIVATILGIVSMVPGGLGSFDVFMLLSLAPLGIDNSKVIIWLLFYRLFYYVIPFIVGLIFFIHGLGQKINRFLDGLPVSILRKLAHGVLTLLLYTAGILILLEAILPGFTFNNPFLLRFYPYTLFFLSQLTTILCGFMLLGLARGIESKISRAYWPTIVFLLIGMADTLRYGISDGLLGFLFVVLLLVVFSHSELYRQRFVYSTEKLVLDGGLFMLVFLLYAIIGAVNSPQYMLHHHVPEVLLFPSEKVWFSGFIGLILAAGVLLLTFSYLAAGPRQIERLLDLTRAKAIIKKYAGNETSHLVFLNDKLLYFYQSQGCDQLFFMYRRKANKIMIMGEPVGNRQFLPQAVSQLLKLADLENCQLVFYEINSELTLYLHELGFDFIKIGEEGLVDLEQFTLAGKKQRAQRAIMNRLARQGYHFEILQPPFTSEFLENLNQISDEWLNGQTEKGFSMGFFDIEYLNQAPIAVVKDQTNEVVAFASLMPVNQAILSIDLMRYRRDVADGTMDMIFIELFNYGKQQGYQYFNMGMAPLANVGKSRYSFLEEKAAHLIYEYGSHFYGFQGLRSFKDKYVTLWRPKYTAYRRRSSLLITMAQLTSVINHHEKVTAESKLRRIWLFNKI